MKLTYNSPEIEIVVFASSVCALSGSNHETESPVEGNPTVPIPDDDDFNPFA